MNISISVVVPTYQRNPCLVACIASLAQQTYKPQEVIIVDNTLAKEAKAVIESLRAKTAIPLVYVSESRKGRAQARNKGIAHARATYIAWLDDDCVADAQWLAQAVEALAQHERAILTGRSLSLHCEQLYVQIDDFLTKQTFFSEGSQTVTYLDSKNCVFAKACVQQFNGQLNAFEDIDLSFQAHLRNIPILYVPKMLVYHHNRASFIQMAQREWNKGRNYAVLQAIWKSYTGKVTRYEKYPLIKMALKSRQQQQARYKNKLKKALLGTRPLLFAVQFYFYLGILSLIRQLGYRVAQLHYVYKSNRA